jgi:hypothetical protein
VRLICVSQLRFVPLRCAGDSAISRSQKKLQALEVTGEWADLRDPEILAQLNSQL